MDTDPAMLSVTYIPPEGRLRNGDVTRYVIRYIRVGSGVLMMTISESSSIGFRTSVIPGLVAFTSYSVEVAAVNVNGTGPFSDVVTGLSGEDSEWITLVFWILHTISGPATAPRSITADTIQSYYVTLSWLYTT